MRLVMATQLRLSAVQMVGLLPGIVTTTSDGATAALTGTAALALVAVTLASAFALAFAAAVVLAAVCFCSASSFCSIRRSCRFSAAISVSVLAADCARASPMATALKEVAAMIATEVNRLIRMSASPENLRSVNTRRQTAGEDRVETGKSFWWLTVIFPQHQCVIERSRDMPKRKIRPISR